nr:NAD(P)-dependent alcohol dehydrogenase [Oceanococcus sp. HetDA_MAG_MS8]
MTTRYQAWAATEVGGKLSQTTIEAGPLGENEVEIAVESCGLCHSDLSMLDNEWGRSDYPLVPGHEVVGRVIAKGAAAQGPELGERVGLGWFSHACGGCASCLDGAQNLCGQSAETIVGRHGGFAQVVRAHWMWTIPIPDALDPISAGPLFCGGITVFHPFVAFDIKPTDRVAVVGVGGLGHLALQFAKAWGCEVTALSSSPDKADEAQELGAHRVVNSRDKEALKGEAGRHDVVLVTVNVPLDWQRYLQALAPKGRLHFVGAVLEPVPVPAFSLIGGQRSLSGSPMGTPTTTRQMLEFCARHNIQPQVQTFPMSEVNAAIDHARAGKARYRVVLEQDQPLASELS